MAMLTAGAMPLSVYADSAMEAAMSLPRYRLQVHRAPLTEAMKEFGLQTHLQVAHFSDVGAATLQVGPIVGTYTPEEALRLMLSGTGLTYRFVNPRTVAIVRETPSSNAAAAPPPAGDDVSKTPSDEFAGSPVAQNAPPPEQRENAPPRRGIIARLLGLFAACSAAALAANPACAQSTAPSSTAAPAGANATELVEIIVTAQRRSENLQDVPIGISVLSGDDLAKTSYRDITDLQYVVPGLQYNAGNGGGFQIRGVGTQSFDFSSEQGVSVVVDDVVQSGQRQTGLSGLTDLAQVEILRGPQGTLFGKNSTSGVVSVSTNKPVLDQYSASVSADYGEYNDRMLSGTINIPLGSEFALRVNAFGQGQNGFGQYSYLDEDSGTYRDKGVRARLLFQPFDDLQIVLNGNYATHFDNQALLLVTGTPYYLATSALYGASIGPQNINTANNATAYTRYDTFGTSLNVNYDFGPAAFTSITAFIRATQKANQPLNWLPIPPTFFTENFDTVDTYTTSQEFRLASTGSHFLDYVVGLYFNDQTLESTQFTGGDVGSPLPPGVDILVTPGVEGFHADNRNQAVFGQTKFNFTDAWHLILGARYTKDNNSQSIGSQPAPPPPPVYIIAGALPTPGTGSASKENFSYRIAPQYQITPNMMAYVTFSTGYKGPGVAFVDSIYDPYRAETVKSTEIGIKSELLEHRLRLNADVFYEKFKDFQAQVFQELPLPGAYVIGNAGGLKSEGVEGDFDYRITRSFSLSGAVAYDQAVFTNYIDGTNDYTGQRLTDAPLWSWSLAPTYTQSVGDDYQIAASANYNWRSATTTILGTPAADSPAYGLLGARIAFSPAQGKWHAGVYARNLLDKFFYSAGSAELAGVGIIRGTTEDSRRTVGVFGDYSF